MYSFAVQNADAEIQKSTGTMKYVDCSAQQITFGQHVQEGCKDANAGEGLPQKLVEQAMVHEMQYFNDPVCEITSANAVSQIP